MKSIDINILDELSRGSQKAFNSIVDRYYKHIWLYFQKKTKRHEIADELANDVFNRIWRYRGKIVPEQGALEAYIRQIARNIFTDWLQQTEKEKQQQADYAAEYLNGEHRTGGEDALNARMDLAVIVDMLAGVLPEKCCRAFVLSRFHGWSYQEIAEEMSISKDTVRNHMIKAKKILAKLGNLWKYP